MPSEAIDARLKALPKAEVHVHLEGTFEPTVLEGWAHEAQVAMPRPRERLFEFAGLADFLEFLDWACNLADSAERLAELARSFSRRLRDDGTGYADLIISGDADLLVLNPFRHIPIVPPADFVTGLAQ